jgi:hypothetical protein
MMQQWPCQDKTLGSLSIVRTVLTVLCLSSFCSSAFGASRLPFTDGFETGDFSAWDGGRVSGFSVLPQDASAGSFAARGQSVLGMPTDYYQDAYFGDHPRVSGTAATGGLYVKFSHKFDSGFQLGSTARYHKVLLINFEDSNDARREQIILNVAGVYDNGSRFGQYLIENIHWQSNGAFGSGQLFLQNQGAPVTYRPGQWDTIKIYIRPNTLNQSDGIVRVWINGVMKIEHQNISMRQTVYNPNLVIVGSYAPEADRQGTRWWDDVTISETDPDLSDRTAPSAPTGLTVR